ncbi:SNF5-domain-containing protein [Rhizoclosmatium globosum]|uniref:SNF5-domain-containing protein n=1 Tax=Rhizoclosmatium globosum TaxID=329046 RepID=A0A1Y2BQ24_9FUNG|nr:SNF5-domain-containing protein [Rhizoclosmatium globosum]|eukprot:ORY36853.1 SNF5-domain-containing protein [Rhizoclosmatium globosum]
MQNWSEAKEADAQRRRALVAAKSQPEPIPAPTGPFKFAQLPRPAILPLGVSAVAKKGDADAETNSKTDDVVLVPIKLDFDVESHGFRLRDQFTWNLHETSISIEAFANHLCGDFRLNPVVAAPEITKSMKEQIDEFLDISYIRPQRPPCGLLDPIPLPESIETMVGPRKASKEPTQLSQVEEDHANLRVFLKIDVSIGTITVMDNVEWDINCTRNSPELFAECLCMELGLPQEFRVAIAHQLREQIQMYHRSLHNLEHPFDDSEIDDEDLWFNHFLPAVAEARRPEDQLSFAGPTLLHGAQPSTAPASVDEKTLLARKRKSGATRTRGRNALPDRDVARYWSTAVPLWKNGQIAAASVLGKRRTRQDTAIDEDEEKEAGDVQAETFSGMLGSKRQENAREWACANCKVTIEKTNLVRAGPAGPATLCNECGVYFSKTGNMRPKRWFQYPLVIDATRE